MYEQVTKTQELLQKSSERRQALIASREAAANAEDEDVADLLEEEEAVN